VKTVKFVAAGDIHGNEQCPKSVKSLLSFCKDYKPDLVVCIGDLWDFKAIRRGAGNDEQASSLQEDLDCGEDFIREFFKHGEERVFLRGNHDERLWDLAKNTSSGVARDYANDGIANVENIMKETRGRMFAYDSIHGVYTCGSLSFVHGYGHAMHAAKQHSDAYGNVLFGHTHAIDYFRSVSHDLREAWNIGCMSELGPTYNRSQLRRLRWQNGWAFGVIHLEEKCHDVFQAKRRNGKFTLATSIKSF